MQDFRWITGSFGSTAILLIALAVSAAPPDLTDDQQNAVAVVLAAQREQSRSEQIREELQCSESEGGGRKLYRAWADAFGRALELDPDSSGRSAALHQLAAYAGSADDFKRVVEAYLELIELQEGTSRLITLNYALTAARARVFYEKEKAAYIAIFDVNDLAWQTFDALEHLARSGRAVLCRTRRFCLTVR